MDDIFIVFVFLISRWYVLIEITGMHFCDHLIVMLLGVTTATTGWKDTPTKKTTLLQLIKSCRTEFML